MHYFRLFILLFLAVNLVAGEGSDDGDSPEPAAVATPLELSPMIAPLIAPATPIATKPSLERNVDWAGVLRQASLALAFQQAFRVAAQPKTRAELGGPFWKDYGASLRGIRGWRDGDSTFTNYFAHPMMGSMAGYIYLANDRRGEVEFGASRRYWATRLRATGFSAAYSTVFEIGPLSEASVGNVGLHSGTNGAVDFVMTPVGGLGWMVAEDALDKHVIQPIERGANNRWISATLRCVLNPSRSMSHLSRLEPPWRRSGRTLRE